MKNVLVISATPRRNGNSDILAECVVKGARTAGARVEKIRLPDYKINPCRACDACQKKRATPCVQKDDMALLIPKVLAADALVFATPIYFFTVSAQLKLFLDRLYAIGGGGDWTALNGKQGATIFTYAEPNALYSGVINAFGMFRDAFEFLGLKESGCLHAACEKAGEIRKNKAMLRAAGELGRKLAKV